LVRPPQASSSAISVSLFVSVASVFIFNPIEVL
jgi:hypothetical protein